MKSAMAAADRNLLFGIHAIQMGFISHDAFIAAANAWTLEKHKQIGQILVEQGKLKPEVRDALEQMITLRINQTGGDVRKSLATLSSVAGLAEPLAAIGDTEMNESVGVVIDTIIPLAMSAHASPRPDSPLRGAMMSDPDDVGTIVSREVFPSPEPRAGDIIGRFRIVRLIGKGGQGAVYEAHDLSELDRTVALKTTLENRFDSAETIERRRAHLLREGRLNARLEHQFIIPVHGLGSADDGRPFYAMRLLDQINLDTAISNFHCGRDLLHDPDLAVKFHSKNGGKQDSIRPLTPKGMPHDCPTDFIQGTSPAEPDPMNLPNLIDPNEPEHLRKELRSNRLENLESQRNLDFRNLLERFTDICDAIHFAHTRRVLHRDLKPGNIMIGPNGETLVIDWGMAKTKAEIHAESLKDRPAGIPESISAEVDEQYRMSVDGRFIGTLGFAPPEQLEGDLAKLNETTDVYCLGMILFEILTGHNPFYTDEFRSTPRDRRVGWLLAKSREDAPDPITFNPLAPKALSAICRKAIAPDQNDRYTTAAAFSNEVANWLAGEPVIAYQENLQERCRRWVRRNRGKAAAAAVTSMSLTLFSLSLAAVIGQHNTELGRMNRKIANQLIEIRSKSEEAAIQKKIAQDIERIAEGNREIAYAKEKQISQQLTELGRAAAEKPANADEAMDLISQAISIQERIVSSDSIDKQIAISLADNYHLLGILTVRSWGQSDSNYFKRSPLGIRNLTRIDAAKAFFRKSVDEYAKFNDEEAGLDQDSISLKLANAYLALAQTQFFFYRDNVGARPNFHSALSICKRLVERNPKSILFRTTLTECYKRLACLEETIDPKVEAANLIKLALNQLDRDTDLELKEANPNPNRLADISRTRSQLVGRLLAIKPEEASGDLIRSLTKPTPIDSIGGQVRKRFELLSKHIDDVTPVLFKEWPFSKYATFSRPRLISAIDSDEALDYMRNLDDRYMALSVENLRRDPMNSGRDSIDDIFDSQSHNVIAWQIAARSDFSGAEYDRIIHSMRYSSKAFFIDKFELSGAGILPDWLLPIFDTSNIDNPFFHFDHIENPFAHTVVGVAQYRAGQFQDSIKSLEHAIELIEVRTKETSPAIELAFLAMSQWKLDRKRESVATFDRLMQIANDPEFATDSETRQFLREATNLIRPLTLPEDVFQR